MSCSPLPAFGAPPTPIPPAAFLSLPPPRHTTPQILAKLFSSAKAASVGHDAAGRAGSILQPLWERVGGEGAEGKGEVKALAAMELPGEGKVVSIG